jgi:transcriptional regulator with PAS, ATPase and Fis domain
MRRDITELRAQVQELMSAGVRKEEVPLYTTTHELTTHKPQIQPTTIHLSPIREEESSNIVEGSEYIEETLSLDDMERMAILRALERHRGKRREAAKELNISERTLYRKIKEYGLD